MTFLVANCDDDRSYVGQMRKMLLHSALLAGALLNIASGAMAMPRESIFHEKLAIRADLECGPGWHITPWGGCRPNRPTVYYGSGLWPYRYDGYGDYSRPSTDGWHYGYGWYGDDYGQHDDNDNDDNED
ncbi:GCG_CRPN prefix-to-repeats domain-containing protein [Undibacter mobilis]|uniref:Uncharacterized protein n=1 Tax=Undibacter mobilis TaxID=2292256 RepID=A0A371BAK1_9BRAD|nr:hypothetical protein [Undibacter mobilis]RDV04594.1 hypothetical protein DXH78_08475 [Undibacter mobilis]